MRRFPQLCGGHTSAGVFELVGDAFRVFFIFLSESNNFKSTSPGMNFIGARTSPEKINTLSA
jgi:hypothetical protein